MEKFKTIAEMLDAAESGEEFGGLLSDLMISLAMEAHDYVWGGDEDE